MKRRIFLIALLVAVLGALAWFVLHPHEPVYEGKSLSFWLERYESTEIAGATSQEHFQAEQAVRHIGTNALPTFLRLLRARDHRLTVRFGEWLARQNLVKIHLFAAAQKNFLAASGFEILGREARQSVPDLIKIFDANLSDFSRTETARALGCIGPAAKPAIPSLLNGLAEMKTMGRRGGVTAPCRFASAGQAGLVYAFVWPEQEILTALARIHSEPELVVPVLVTYSADTNTMVALLALRGLAAFGPAARPAVPNLVKALAATDASVRSQAAIALRKIDPDTAGKTLGK